MGDRKDDRPAVPSDSLGRVDLVLFSRDHHLDTLGHAARAHLFHANRVITTVEGATRIGGNAIGLSPWESVDIPGTDRGRLRVTGTPAERGGRAHLNRGQSSALW